MPFTVGQYLTANDLKSQEDAHTLGYGVVNGLKVVPTDPASMNVQVETGKAYVADTLVEKGAVTDLTVGAADPTNPRKDIVVCNSAGTLSIVAGTPEAALPNGNVGVYTLNPEPESIPADSIILGEIWVPAGATEITGSEIYDKRVSIADFLTHKGDASAHHAKTGANEVYGLVQAGTAAARPAAGVAGRWYFATNTLILSRDNGTSWVEMARGETAIRLAQLSEKAHGSLTGVSANQHHPQSHTLGSHSTKAHSELTGVTAAQHHAKYTDAEAQATVKANVEVGDLKTPTKNLPMNSKKITGLAAPGAANDAVRADANLRAPDSSKLEGSSKATVQNHTPKAHTLASHSTKAHTELTGVTANQHHAQAHTLASHSSKAHSELTGVTASQHHTKLQFTELAGGEHHTVAVASTWEDYDLSGIIGAGAVCVLVLIGNHWGVAKIAGARKNGSGLNRKDTIDAGNIGGYWDFSLVTECDASRIIEIYANENTNIFFSILGYWS